MALDFYAISSNVAARFEPWNVTPPSGETDIVLSTHELPQGVVQEPTVLVFPPGPDEIEFDYSPGAAVVGTVTIPVRLYLWRIRDKARNVALCLKWLTALYPQLQGQVHLGLVDSGVQHAVVRNLGVARFTYGDDDFDGVALDVEVHVVSSFSPTA